MQEGIKISYNQFHAQVSEKTNASLRVRQELTVCWRKMYMQTIVLLALIKLNNAINLSKLIPYSRVCLPKYVVILILWNYMSHKIKCVLTIKHHRFLLSKNLKCKTNLLMLCFTDIFKNPVTIAHIQMAMCSTSFFN